MTPDKTTKAWGGHERDDEGSRGSAMLLALFMTLLLGAMGFALMFLSGTEQKMSTINLEVKRAFYLAEAGIESGRTELFTTLGPASFEDGIDTADGVDDAINFDVNTFQIVWNSDDTPASLTGFGDDQPLRGLTAVAGGWYAAFLTNDPLDGEAAPLDSNDRVMITAVGILPGRTWEMTQAIIERREILPALPPATITLLGPVPNFWGGSSNSHDYGGDDCAGNGIPGLYVPIVGTIGSAAEAAAETGIHGEGNDNQGPGYDSGTYEDSDTFADLTDPTEPTVAGSGYDVADSVWTDCLALKDLIEEIRNAADVVCCNPPVCATASACVLPPTSINNTVFIDGDYVVGPAGGAGTLVVTGELTYDGHASWQGMIFAIGEGVLDRHGAGGGSVSGAVVVADIAGPDDIYDTVDDCTGGDGGFDSANYDQSGGGNATTNYCTTDLIAAKPRPPFKLVDFRQF